MSIVCPGAERDETSSPTSSGSRPSNSSRTFVMNRLRDPVIGCRNVMWFVVAGVGQLDLPPLAPHIRERADAPRCPRVAVDRVRGTIIGRVAHGVAVRGRVDPCDSALLDGRHGVVARARGRPRAGCRSGSSTSGFSPARSVTPTFSRTVPHRRRLPSVGVGRARGGRRRRAHAACRRGRSRMTPSRARADPRPMIPAAAASTMPSPLPAMSITPSAFSARTIVARALGRGTRRPGAGRPRQGECPVRPRR